MDPDRIAGIFSTAGKAKSVQVSLPDGTYTNLIDGRKGKKRPCAESGQGRDEDSSGKYYRIRLSPFSRFSRERAPLT